jgi:carbon monoxide dehydrogenase subunit G
MKLENSFDVAATPEAAWRLLNDVPAVIPCMPGAELLEIGEAGEWKAMLHVKLGPIALQFQADVRRELVDEAGRQIVLAVKAREVKGRGSADATITSAVTEGEAGTRVEVVTDLTLRGPVSQYGRGVIANVAASLTRQFATCLEERLSAGRSPTDEGGVQGAARPAGTAVADHGKPVGVLRLLLRALLHRGSRRSGSTGGG